MNKILISILLLFSFSQLSHTENISQNLNTSERQINQNKNESIPEQKILYLEVKITVNPYGNVDKATINKSSGNAELDQKVLQIVQQTKFKPFVRNGEAQPFSVIQPFKINVDDIKKIK